MVEAPHKYLHAFIAEATEQLEQLASELVRIEQGPPDEDRASSGTLVARLSTASSALPDVAPAAVSRPPKQKVEADPALPRVDVAFSLTKSCQAPGARALIVQRKLRSAGTLLEMEPQPGSLMQKKGGARVMAVLATARSVDEVRALFDGIPEVEEIAVRPSPPANAPPPPE